MLTLGTFLEIVSHLQALDYLNTHAPHLYAVATSTNAIVALIIAGFAMLGFAILEMRRFKPSENGGSASNSASTLPPAQPVSSTASANGGNATATGGNATGGNATGGSAFQHQELDIHIHNPPPQLPEPPSVPRVEEPKESSRLTFLGAKVINVRLGNGGLYEVSDAGDSIGIKMCFRNQVVYGQPTKTAYGVKAHLRFMDDAGSEIGEGVSGIQWLGGSTGDMANIRKGESECVCILLMAKRQPPVFQVPRNTRVSTGRLGRFGFVDDSPILPQLPRYAELSLINDMGLLLPPMLIEITLTDGILAVAPKEQK